MQLLKKENFLILGAGNMGICFVKSLLNNKIRVNRINIVEKKPSLELLKLKRKYKIRVHKNCKGIKASSNPTIVLLAVKPNQLSNAIDSEFITKTENSIIISIIAGKSHRELKRISKNNKCVRAMTNTPASVGMGTSLVYYDRSINQKDKKLVNNFLSLIGQVNETNNEKQMDIFTAIFGGGPAYVYLFIDVFTELSKKAKFKNSKKMVIQTFLGSLLLLLSEDDEPINLKKKVTSKGGTTESALSILESNKGLSSLMHKAFKKAEQKSKILNKI